MGNLQTAKFQKKMYRLRLSGSICFTNNSNSTHDTRFTNDTSKQNSTDNYVDMYYLATHPEEFKGKSITTIGIVRYHALAPMFEDFQLDCQSEERIGPNNRFILVVTRPAGLTNPNYGSLVELSGKWESTDLDGGYYYLNATKLSTIEAMPKFNFSEKDFPLEIDLPKTDYNVGEQIALNATIINRSGKDVNMLSNGNTSHVQFSIISMIHLNLR